jgi:hypothetical protein
MEQFGLNGNKGWNYTVMLWGKVMDIDDTVVLGNLEGEVLWQITNLREERLRVEIEGRIRNEDQEIIDLS